MFTLKIDTEGAAFRDFYTGEKSSLYETIEIDRILRKTADAIRYGGQRSGSILDINGNKIGEFSITEE